jgi:hypothetical protein
VPNQHVCCQEKSHQESLFARVPKPPLGLESFAIWFLPSLVLDLLWENIVGCALFQPGEESNRAEQARLDDHDQSGRELEAKAVGF